MKVKILGGGLEVGRSGILVNFGENKQLLLDYGVMLTNGEPEFPSHVSPKDLDAVILSHAHLDHSGGIPLLYITEKPKFIATRLTAEITELLIQDFIHLTGYYLPYENLELKTMMKALNPVFYGDELKVGKAKIKILNAGHIPGSMMIMVEADGKRILYTGDLNTVNTRLLKGASMKVPKLDALIIEGTYATVDHPDRAETEKEFIAAVTEVVERGGIALVPAFSVGRSQEILCVLTAHKLKYPVTLDGMARKASKIMFKHPRYFRNYKLLTKALEKAKWVSGWSDRRKACKKPGIIVSPAGMLKGGTAVFYMKKIARNEKNAVILVSYQIPGTPGHILLESGVFNFGKRVERVKAEVRWFDFSSHCGKKDLLNIISKMKKNTKIIMVHSEEDSAKSFVNEVKDALGIEVITPSNEEEIEI
ncbi:MAG: MBL fold metallo-hydrolase [archaeon GB-1867-005]|nr:MBL fold metallo-hydrolase [Candidatus Culexmicrobium cathedralense]